MKKLFITTILVSSIFTNIKAQGFPPIYLTGSCGLATAKSSFTSDNKRFSQGLGAEINIRIVKKLALVLRPTFNFRGYKNSSFDLKATYFDIPINLEYKYYDFLVASLYVGAGGYFGYITSGKYKNSSGGDWISMKIGESATDSRSNMDAGLNFTTGIKIKKVKIGAQYQYGLKNVVPKDAQVNGAEIKLQNICVYLAVRLV